MKTLVTRVTERGQVSIPATIRKRLNLVSGKRVVWETVSPRECRMKVMPEAHAPGAVAMLGYAAKFRRVRRTRAWMKDLRMGETP